MTRQAEASRRTADLIELKALPLLERIALALERAPVSNSGAAPLETLEDLERSRTVASEDLRARIEAARQANDPDGAMTSRDELAGIVPVESMKELDQSLVKWLLSAIQRRLRTGTIRPDVVELAGRVADRFGATTEGASLRAALPTLRRSAGLCPKCGEPYTGLGAACHKCVAAASPDPTSAGEALGASEDDLEIEIEFVGEEVDLNQERFWITPEES